MAAPTEEEEKIDQTFDYFVASLKAEAEIEKALAAAGKKPRPELTKEAREIEGNVDVGKEHFIEALKASGISQDDISGLPKAAPHKNILVQIEEMVRAGKDPKTSDIKVGDSDLSDFGVPDNEKIVRAAHTLGIMDKHDNRPEYAIQQFLAVPGWKSKDFAGVDKDDLKTFAARAKRIATNQGILLDVARNMGIPVHGDGNTNPEGINGPAITAAVAAVDAIKRDPDFPSKPGVDPLITAAKIIDTQANLKETGLTDPSVADAIKPNAVDEAKALNKLGISSATLADAETAFKEKYHLDSSVPVLSDDGKSGPLINVMQKELLAAKSEITAPAGGFDAHKLSDIDKYTGIPSDLTGLTTALEKGHADLGAATGALDKAVLAGAEKGVLGVTDGIVGTDDLAKVSPDPKKPVSLEDVATAELNASRLALNKLGFKLSTDSPTATADDVTALKKFEKDQGIEGAAPDVALARFGEEIAQIAKIILTHGGDLKAAAADPALTHVAVPAGLKGHDDTPSH